MLTNSERSVYKYNILGRINPWEDLEDEMSGWNRVYAREHEQ